MNFIQTISELQQLIDEKLDLASHDVTLKATQLMNSETLNLQSVFQDEQVRLYIWGNLSKNPRYVCTRVKLTTRAMQLLKMQLIIFLVYQDNIQFVS